MRSKIIDILELFFCRGAMESRKSAAIVTFFMLLITPYLLSVPIAEAKHNRFIGTPRSSVPQSNSATTEEFSDEEDEKAPKSESVSIDQPEPVDFSSETKIEEASSSEVAPVRETESALLPEPDLDSAESNLDNQKSFNNDTRRARGDSVRENSSATAANKIEESINQSSEPLAVTWYREKAEQGDVDAQFNLAMISETGFGIEKNEEAAIEWYSKAASKGHAEAQLKLGMLYLLGLGAPESRIKGGKWIRSSARQDNRFARVLSEKFLSKNIEGLEVSATLKEVRKVYNAKSPKQAEDKLLTMIAKADIKSKNRPKKERFAGGVTGSAAKAGSVGNQVPDFLADNKVQKGVEGNSLSRIRRHAKDGVAEAQYQWGVILEEGNQVPADKAQAVKWFEAAADQNHPGGQYKLAIANMFGVGVPLDVSQGKEYLVQSARQDHPVAKKLLQYVGRADVTKGAGNTNSITVAWHLQKAIEKNDGNAMLSLGYMFQNGWGVTRDHNEGIQWMNKAKAAGATEASRQLRIAKVSDMSVDASNQALTRSSAVRQSNKDFAQSMDRDATAAIVGNSIPEANDNRKIARAVSRVINKIKKRAKDLVSQDSDKQKPLMLIIGGLILGFLVFRIMRRPGNRHSQSAYKY